MNSYKNRNITGSTKEYLVQLEEAVNRNLPSMNGYFQKQYFEMMEDVPKVDCIEKDGEICSHCGIPFTHKSMKLKLKRKKKIINHRSCSEKLLVITCKKCNMSSMRDSGFEKIKSKPVPKKVKLKTLSCPITNNNTSKDFNKTHTPNNTRMNSMLLKNDVNTPLSSPFITPDSAGSKSKRKRGKSFSPLTSQDQSSAKKSSSGKPSLLSFLTSL